MKPIRAIVTDRKSGNIFHCNFSTTREGFVVLQNPIQKKTVFGSSYYFENGQDNYKSIIQYYGESCRDLMIPNKRVFVEIVAPNEKIDWIDVTEIEANNIIKAKEEEAIDKYRKDKSKYYENKNDIEKFFLRLFNKI